jgi:hypothetical protein
VRRLSAIEGDLQLQQHDGDIFYATRIAGFKNSRAQLAAFPAIGVVKNQTGFSTFLVEA